jgi:hypothetical protein
MSDLARITFTGVDDRTDIGALRAICVARPRVEFAVLWSESRSGNEPRYPSNPVELAKKLPEGRRAIHLCGGVAKRFAAGPPFDYCAAALARFGGRVQVNRGGYSSDELLALGYTAKALRTPVIVQSRSPKIPWIPGVSVLHDCSGGRGIAPAEWPAPEWLYEPEDVPAYAGSLGPDNIATELPRIAAARGEGLFGIDMESRVRTDDWFDVGKVLRVLKAVDEWEASNG